MYCQHCGAETTTGLNYCNRCGGNLGALTQRESRELGRPVSNGAAWAVGISTFLLAVGGLGMLGAMLTDLMHSGVRPEPLVVMMICGAATILGSVFMLTRFWMRMFPAAKPEAPDSPRLFQPATHTNELGPQRFAGALHDAPIPSVTEHTTRTLEHAKKR